jgi:Zn-finger nucleic acid-binding protein
MQTVDRYGIHIEQCENCRGIFLDRGELEQIADAERRHYAAPPVPPYQPEPGYGPGQPRERGYRDSPPAYRDSPPGYGGHSKRRRRSFLEELFD